MSDAVEIIDSKPSEAGVRPLASALKTLDLLDHLGRSSHPARLAQLARDLGVGRATIYQRLVTLIAAGWVEQTEEGRFRLTLRAARLAQAATEQAGLGARTLPVLEALTAETGEAASLAAMEGDEPCILQRVEPKGLLRVEMRVGATMSLTESASGRVLLAFAAPERMQSLVPRAAEVDAAVLDQIRRTGHAISTGRSIDGVRAAAVPVFDHRGVCIAALSLVAPLQRFPKDGWIAPLQEAAGRLGDILKGRSA